MKVSTAGGLTALFGAMGSLVHGGLTLITALGSNLASTPDDHVSSLANTLWMISLYGTLVAVAALVGLMMWWTKPLAIIYSLAWVTLIGCYWTGWIIDAGDHWLDRPVLLLLEAALPLASVVFGLYGVWKYRSAGT